MKRIISVITVLVLCLALCAGCAGKKQVPAAQVGDKIVTVSQLENMYNNNSAYASYYGYALTDDAGIEAFQDYMLASLVESKMKQYQAELAGVTLTDEELASAEATAKESYDEMYQSYVSAAENAGATDPEAYANTLLTDSLLESGMTVRKIKQEYLDDAKASLLISKHKEMLLEGVSADEEKLKEIYEEQLASQKESFDEDPSAYFTQESYASYGYSYVPLYMPEGFFRVRQILVADEATAQEVLDKLDAGEDFEALLTEYNTDPGMDSMPEGYLIGTGASYVEEFLNAALALENDGDVSGAVESEYGYHIIKRVSTEESGAIPYEEIQESFETLAKSEYLNTYYNDIVNAWLADESLVTYYPENYRGIGKA